MRPTLESMAADGAVAVKYEAAYLRRLDFAPATLEQARAVYDRYRSGGAPPMAVYKPLQDYLFRYIGVEAGRLKMAVHIHSADGAGGYFEASGADPILLESAFSDPTLRQTNFVIVHGGWPHVRNTMSLFSRPNAFADFSFMGNSSSRATRSPECCVNGSASSRNGFCSAPTPTRTAMSSDGKSGAGSAQPPGAALLGLALTGMMRDGEITSDRAREIARMVLRDNAANLYRIP